MVFRKQKSSILMVKTSAVSEFSPMLLLFAKLHQALLISLLNKCFIKESNKAHKCLYF